MNGRKKMFWIVPLLGVVLAGGIGWWVETARRFSSPPKPGIESPKRVAEFVSSPQFVKLPDLAQQDYLVNMLNTYNTPEKAQKFLSEVKTFSPSQIMAFRDNAIKGFLRVKFLKEAIAYRGLKSQEQRNQFVDQNFRQLEGLEAWLTAIKKNPDLQKTFSVNNYMDTFKSVMERSTPMERAAMETYIWDTFRRYAQRNGVSLK